MAAVAAAALPDRKCHAMHLFSSLSFVRTYNHPTTVPRGAVLYSHSKVMGETLQAALLTHERFLTIDHSFKIFF